MPFDNAHFGQAGTWLDAARRAADVAILCWTVVAKDTRITKEFRQEATRLRRETQSFREKFG
jgi:hypothetical protein